MFYPLPGSRFVLGCIMASCGLSALHQNGWVGVALGAALLLIAFVLAFGRLIAFVAFALQR